MRHKQSWVAVLYEKHCQHQDKYDGPEYRDDEWFWNDCRDCKLRDMSYDVPHSLGIIQRDICFAIWHDAAKQRFVTIR